MTPSSPSTAINTEEYLAGTNPTDPQSLFQITTVTAGSLKWNTVSNRTYTVMRSSTLPPSPQSNQMFYRIRVTFP
ncbi:MAG: hypothetical protein ACSHYF_02535 [Verrucomicrobiaceae bacterium]